MKSESASIIEALKAEIVAKDKDLKRVALVLEKESDVLLNLLDRIRTLDIDEVAKRLMAETCLHLLKIDQYEKMLKIVLTDSDVAFIRKLQKKHPCLSLRDLRICLFTMLKYEATVIADSEGMTTRGMETVRYRIHKKLGLAKHQSMKTYFVELVMT